MSWRFWEQAPAPAPAAGPTLACSFCGKSQREVAKLIAGEGVYICDGCVQLSHDVVEGARPRLPTAAEAAGLEARLVARVPGREAAARILHNLVQHHLSGEVGPPAALLVGPRGSGKSALLDALRAEAGLPAVRVDVGRLSASGYVGDDLESFLGELTAQGPHLAHRGVLLLDNLQHLAARERPEGTAIDVRGTRAQRQLVRLLDGRPARASPGRRHPSQSSPLMETRGLLVVLAVTLDPLPDTVVAARVALVAAGIEPAVLRRAPVVLPMPRRDPATMRAVAARMATDLGVEGVDLDGIAAQAAASPDGAWVLRQRLAAAAARA